MIALIPWSISTKSNFAETKKTLNYIKNPKWPPFWNKIHFICTLLNIYLFFRSDKMVWVMVKIFISLLIKVKVIFKVKQRISRSKIKKKSIWPWKLPWRLNLKLWDDLVHPFPCNSILWVIIYPFRNVFLKIKYMQQNQKRRFWYFVRAITLMWFAIELWILVCD